MEEVWTKLGKQPRYQEMQKPLSKFSSATYENRFGTWKALDEFVNYVNNDVAPSAELTVEPKTFRVTEHREV